MLPEAIRVHVCTHPSQPISYVQLFISPEEYFEITLYAETAIVTVTAIRNDLRHYTRGFNGISGISSCEPGQAVCELATFELAGPDSTDQLLQCVVDAVRTCAYIDGVLE